MLEVGKKAPEVSMPTSGGGHITLKQFQGKNKVVLYFYPKDDTPGCTMEAKDFKDRIKEFQKANTVVIGVSKDSVTCHDKFISKYDLPFILASDETGEVCEAYGLWVQKSMYGKKYMGIERTTLLIDEQGIIRYLWPKVKVEGHVDEVLAKAEAL